MYHFQYSACVSCEINQNQLALTLVFILGRVVVVDDVVVVLIVVVVDIAFHIVLVRWGILSRGKGYGIG